MKRLIQLIPILFLLFSYTVSAQSGGIDFFKGTMEEAMTKAKEENKILFVDAYTVWCGPCKWMSRNVFNHPRVGYLYNKHFVNVKLDMETPEGSTFAIIHQVNAYPTLVFIDGDGKEYHRVLGAQPVDRFLAAGRQVITEAKVKARMYMPSRDRSE
ncbi:MAG: thioredoxin family protein [Bacteroidota bacterium]